eukprot:gene2336-1468_t
MSVIAGQRTMVQADKATLNRFTQADMKVERLPGRTFPNPCKKRVLARAYKDDVEEIMFDPKPQKRVEGFPLSRNELTCELAAARSTIHFNPSETTFGIVTCGGICPGLNDVIRSITLAGIEQYGVKRVIGFRFGYWGLSKEGSKNAIELSRATLRGPQTPQEMVDTLERLGVNVLFTVGGDGTQRGALRIYEEARKRGANISVFGVPKTIDNDLSFSHRTFGFQTAVEKGTEAVRAAYAEASSLHYGVGIVKLMGRDSGFIAAQTAVASAQANICLIPERPLPKETVLKLIERHFQRSKNCVIIVAEGFGQDWVSGPGGHDASGNKKLIDIGALLKKEVEGWLKANVKKYPQYQVKYIDPSYMIRACPPTPNDALFCNSLATLAVHEAMAGATGCIIAMRYNNYILVPIRVATSVRRVLDIKGLLWRQVRELTVGLNGDAKTEIREDIRREMLALEREEARLKARLAQLVSLRVLLMCRRIPSLYMWMRNDHTFFGFLLCYLYRCSSKCAVKGIDVVRRYTRSFFFWWRDPVETCLFGIGASRRAAVCPLHKRNTFSVTFYVEYGMLACARWPISSERDNHLQMDIHPFRSQQRITPPKSMNTRLCCLSGTEPIKKKKKKKLCCGVKSSVHILSYCLNATARHRFLSSAAGCSARGSQRYNSSLLEATPRQH